MDIFPITCKEASSLPIEVIEQPIFRHQRATDGRPRVWPLFGPLSQRQQRGPHGPLLQRIRDQAEAQ